MRVLLVEDNIRLAETVAGSLRRAGLEVDAVGSGEDALNVAKDEACDAMILDLGLPDIDGIEVLQKLRAAKNPLPVLILTARGGLTERVAGLDSGADDYLVKPFEVIELVARVKALLRRPSQSVGTVITLNDISFDTVRRTTRVGEELIGLTRRETDLLEQLLMSAEQVVTKSAIEQRMYSYGDKGSANSVEVLVSRLRRKLAACGANVGIHTLKGVGYMMSKVLNNPPAQK